MSREEIIDRLKTLLVGSAGVPQSLLASEHLTLVGEDGSVDSVAVLRLVIGLEQEFGIVIDDTDVGPENFHNLNSLTDFVYCKLS